MDLTSYDSRSVKPVMNQDGIENGELKKEVPRKMPWFFIQAHKIGFSGEGEP